MGDHEKAPSRVYVAKFGTPIGVDAAYQSVFCEIGEMRRGAPRLCIIADTA